jgi:hypothetical protein
MNLDLHRLHNNNSSSSKIILSAIISLLVKDDQRDKENLDLPSLLWKKRLLY